MHPHTIQLYQIDLTTPITPRLTPEEQARAGRFARAQDRHQFTSTRTALRQILARYTPYPTILTTRQGKPYLAEGPHFNVSHSETHALIAIAQTPVGIDIEAHRPLEDLVELATQIMTPAELISFQALPEAIRPSTFYSLWTRKESLLKAIGTGLLTDPRTIHLGLLTAQSTVQIAALPWTTLPLPSPRHTSAAVSIQSTMQVPIEYHVFTAD